MKLPHSEADQNIDIQGALKERSFKLDEHSTAHLMFLLREGIYKDPILAVVREYWTNAKDSVQMAGGDITKDVIVTAPTAESPFFSVKDYGLGLNEQEVFKYYAQYGASQKRDTDVATGCLGIGCKCAFAYKGASSFFLTATKNGVKREFVAYSNPDSIHKDDQGKIVKMQETPTEEKNSVEIRIPVKHADIPTFCSSIRCFFSTICISKLPVFVNIDVAGAIKAKLNDEFGLLQKLEGAFSEFEVNIYSSDAYFVYLYLEMGDITYKIDRNEKFKFSLLTALAKLNNACIVIKVPMGAVDFAISRESLRFTDKTNNFLSACDTKIKEKLDELIKDNIGEQPSFEKALLLYTNMSHAFGANVFQMPLFYKGQALKTKLSLDAYLVKECYNGNTVQALNLNINDNKFDIRSFNNAVFLLDDGVPQSSTKTRKVRNFLKNQSEANVYVVRESKKREDINDPISKNNDDILFETMIQEFAKIPVGFSSKLTPISSLPYPKQQRATSAPKDKDTVTVYYIHKKEFSTTRRVNYVMSSFNYAAPYGKLWGKKISLLDRAKEKFLVEGEWLDKHEVGIYQESLGFNFLFVSKEKTLKKIENGLADYKKCLEATGNEELLKKSISIIDLNSSKALNAKIAPILYGTPKDSSAAKESIYFYIENLRKEIHMLVNSGAIPCASLSSQILYEADRFYSEYSEAEKLSGSLQNLPILKNKILDNDGLREVLLSQKKCFQIASVLAQKVPEFSFLYPRIALIACDKTQSKLSKANNSIRLTLQESLKQQNELKNS